MEFWEYGRRKGLTDEEEIYKALFEDFPIDEVTMPLKPDGTNDYEAVKNLPKNTRDEKIAYCALSNKFIPLYIWVSFGKLTDEQLQREVEKYDDFWEGI